MVIFELFWPPQGGVPPPRGVKTKGYPLVLHFLGLLALKNADVFLRFLAVRPIWGVVFGPGGPPRGGVPPPSGGVWGGILSQNRGEMVIFELFWPPRGGYPPLGGSGGSF